MQNISIISILSHHNHRVLRQNDNEPKKTDRKKKEWREINFENRGDHNTDQNATQLMWLRRKKTKVFFFILFSRTNGMFCRWQCCLQKIEAASRCSKQMVTSTSKSKCMASAYRSLFLLYVNPIWNLQTTHNFIFIFPLYQALYPL